MRWWLSISMLCVIIVMTCSLACKTLSSASCITEVTEDTISSVSVQKGTIKTVVDTTETAVERYEWTDIWWVPLNDTSLDTMCARAIADIAGADLTDVMSGKFEEPKGVLHISLGKSEKQSQNNGKGEQLTQTIDSVADTDAHRNSNECIKKDKIVETFPTGFQVILIIVGAVFLLLLFLYLKFRRKK